ncbi:PAS-domain containing protein [Insolitispirillum peregrinum]|uniref:hybrid sensor histidine kinase/response regulator n=1 Tax=Insolitispirillum peregrinum TaxID=80876 RepID=UPI00360693C5
MAEPPAQDSDITPAPSTEAIQATLSELTTPLKPSRMVMLAGLTTCAGAVSIVYAAVSEHLSIIETITITTAILLLLCLFGSFGWRRLQAIHQRLRDSAYQLSAIEQQLAQAAHETDRLQRLLVDAVNSVDEGFVLFDDTNTLVVCNERYRRAYPTIADLLVPGASFSTILATAAQRLGVAGDHGPQDLRQWVEDRMRRHLSAPQPQECQLTDGRWYRISERPTRTGGIVKVLTDITMAKQHEQELASKSKVLEGTFDAMAQGIAVFDTDLTLLTWNDHLAPVMDYPAHLLQPGTALQAFRDFDFQRGVKKLPAPHPVDNMPDPFSPHDDTDTLLSEVELPDGRHVDVHTSPMPRGGLVVMYSDITTRKQTEAALQHSQKMDAIGQLAGGIAHEFNNMLTSIGGFARMALRSPEDSERVVMCLEEVTKAADRAASLTSQLLNFSRRSLSEEQRPIRLKDMLRDLTNFLRPLLGARVDVDVQISDPDLIVSGDPVKLHQAIVNLCINARDAMPEGGEIQLSLSRLARDHSEANRRLFDRHPLLSATRAYAALRVRDTGTGIDPALLPRIFEPFFTTKEQGKGTGLGLPMVYSVAEHMGGIIDVESEVRVGSLFTVLLPLCEPDTIELSKSAERQRDFNGEDLTILLAEDEDSVRRLITMTLEDAGCTVLTAENGHEAEKIFEQDQDAIDILISDVVMPGLDGPALTRRLLDLNPDLRVILMSGYSATDDWKALTEGCGRTFLRKPVVPDQLLAAVQTLVNRVE